VVAVEQYNSLKMAAARGEISRSVYEYSRDAFFFAAEGDSDYFVKASKNGGNGDVCTVYDGDVRGNESGFLSCGGNSVLSLPTMPGEGSRKQDSRLCKIVPQ
jgi:hypothetical protein